jgi:hypothetical protein
MQVASAYDLRGALRAPPECLVSTAAPLDSPVTEQFPAASARLPQPLQHKLLLSHDEVQLKAPINLNGGPSGQHVSDLQDREQTPASCAGQCEHALSLLC